MKNECIHHWDTCLHWNSRDSDKLITSLVNESTGRGSCQIQKDEIITVSPKTKDNPTGLDESNPDSDGDGISDYAELTGNEKMPTDPKYHHGWVTDPTNSDTDGDFDSDYKELTILRNGASNIAFGLTDPRIKDTDRDGKIDSEDDFPLSRPIRIQIKAFSITGSQGILDPGTLNSRYPDPYFKYAIYSYPDGKFMNGQSKTSAIDSKIEWGPVIADPNILNTKQYTTTEQLDYDKIIQVPFDINYMRIDISFYDEDGGPNDDGDNIYTNDQPLDIDGVNTDDLILNLYCDLNDNTVRIDTTDSTTEHQFSNLIISNGADDSAIDSNRFYDASVTVLISQNWGG